MSSITVNVADLRKAISELIEGKIRDKLESNPAIFFKLTQLRNNEYNPNLDLQGNDYSDKKLFQALGYNMGNVPFEGPKYKCYYIKVQNYSIETIARELSKIPVDDKSNHYIIVLDFENTEHPVFKNTQEERIPIDLDVFKVAHQFLVTNDIRNNCNIWSQDYRIDYTSYEYLDLVEYSIYEKFNLRVADLINESFRLNSDKKLNMEALLNIYKDKKGIYVPENKEKISPEVIFVLSYISLYLRIPVVFQNVGHDKDFYKFCSNIFKTKLTSMGDIRNFLESINEDYFVYIRDAKPCAFAKPFCSLRRLEVPAVDFNFCLLKYESETIIASASTEMLIINPEEKIYGLAEILPEVFLNFAMDISKNTTDVKLKTSLEDIKNSDVADAVKKGQLKSRVLDYLLFRLNKLARICLVKDLVSLSELCFIKRDGKIYMFCLPRSKKSLNCELYSFRYDRENKPIKSNHVITFDDILPTYLFEIFTEVNISKETKTQIDGISFEELRSIFWSNQERGKSLMENLKRKGSYKSLMHFYRPSYTDKMSELYRSLLATEPNVEKIANVELNGRLLGALKQIDIT